MPKTKSALTSKKILLPALIAFLLLGAGSLYALNQRSNSQPADDTDTVNLDPATKEDSQRAEETKQQIVAKEKQEKSQAAQTSGNKQTVKPVITYADQQGVGAYVPVFEDGGNCTATYVKGGASFTKSVTAVKNVNTTTCPEMTTSGSDFSSKGTWTVTVSYDSATYGGRSDPRTIEVK